VVHHFLDAPLPRRRPLPYLGLRNTGGHDETLPLAIRALADDQKAKVEISKRLARLLRKKGVAEYEDRSLDGDEAEVCLKDAKAIMALVRGRSKGF